MRNRTSITLLNSISAFQRLERFWKTYDFNTGNSTEDAEVKQLVLQLLNDPLLCQPTFDEAMLFKGHDKTSLMPLMKCVYHLVQGDLSPVLAFDFH